MYRITTDDGGGQFEAWLDAEREVYTDLVPLGDQIAELMREDMLERRMAGTDRLDDQYADLAPSTLKKRQREGGFGTTPFVGHGAESRIISRYTVEVTSPEPWIVVITGHWPGVDWIKYHVDPGMRTRVPLRDFLGVSEAYDTLIHERADEFLKAR